MFIRSSNTIRFYANHYIKRELFQVKLQFLMRAKKIYASYSNDNNPTYHVICILGMYLLYVRNTQKRHSIVKEVEVDRGTVAKSVPKYIKKNILRVIAQCDIISSVYTQHKRWKYFPTYKSKKKKSNLIVNKRYYCSNISIHTYIHIYT